jgi:hypothetical protein
VLALLFAFFLVAGPLSTMERPDAVNAALIAWISSN